MLTLEQLIAIMPYAGKTRAAMFLWPLNEAMKESHIDTPGRQAAFLAQIAHESGSLRYVREIASGSAYEGRKALGNTQKGDGVRYKGRGLIQITGRANYTECAKALDLPLVDHPYLLEVAGNACRSAAWFWQSRNLNELADADRFTDLTKKINGGTNGLDDRKSRYRLALSVIK